MNTQRVRALVDIFWNGTELVAVPAGSEGTMILARYPTPSDFAWISWSVDGMGVYKQASPNQYETVEEREQS